MASFRMRYYHRINANRSFLPQSILDLGNVTTWLILGFKKFKNLSNKIFLTSDIETLDYCMEVCRQHLNNERMDFFIADKWELHETVTTIERVLFNLKLNLTRLFTTMYSLFPKNSKFQKDLKKNQRIV